MVCRLFLSHHNKSISHWCVPVHSQALNYSIRCPHPPHPKYDCVDLRTSFLHIHRASSTNKRIKKQKQKNTTHTPKKKKNTTKETTKKTPHNFSFSSRSNPSQFEVINIFHPPKYLLIALHQLCPSNQQDITENRRAVSLKALVSIKLHTETKPKP